MKEIALEREMEVRLLGLERTEKGILFHRQFECSWKTYGCRMFSSWQIEGQDHKERKGPMKISKKDLLDNHINSGK
jgi:hypothetical protein